MKQLTIFDTQESETIQIIPRPGIIKNQVSIYYEGIHVANAKDCGKGIYEVRPRALFFNLRFEKIQMMNKGEIEKLCEGSFVKYEL